SVAQTTNELRAHRADPYRTTLRRKLRAEPSKSPIASDDASSPGATFASVSYDPEETSISRLSTKSAASLSGLLVVQPEVFKALAVVDAIDLGNEAFDLRVIAVRGSRVEENRPRVIVGQFLLDCPYQLLALRDIADGRLPVYHFVEFRVAVAGVVAQCPA